MHKLTLMPLLLVSSAILSTAPQAEQGDKQWIARSNQFTQMLVDISNRHSPENASSQGLKEYDEKIGQPTKADSDGAIAETRAVLAKFQAQRPNEKDKMWRKTSKS